MPGQFLDTSSLGKLYHPEVGSERMEMLARLPDSRLVISEISLIEIQSVFSRKVRSGAIALKALEDLRGLFFTDLTKRRFDLVLLTSRHLRDAENLVRKHAIQQGLRTLDAIQLAVALDCHRRGIASIFVASDKNLCTVAAMENLTVINPLFDA